MRSTTELYGLRWFVLNYPPLYFPHSTTRILPILSIKLASSLILGLLSLEPTSQHSSLFFSSRSFSSKLHFLHRLSDLHLLLPFLILSATASSFFVPSGLITEETSSSIVLALIADAARLLSRSTKTKTFAYSSTRPSVSSVKVDAKLSNSLIKRVTSPQLVHKSTSKYLR